MKNKRQYRSNQGRSPKQQRGNEIAAFISFVGLIATLCYIILTN
jgi:hypothetical protein|tara:strand:- start:1378 stop:1509 length:132 start_codon:yes stop_codon:yes gene_type:complete